MLNTRHPKAAGLLQGMADRLGVRLTEVQGIEPMSARCDACVRHDDCILWMMDHPAASVAPGYCRNAEELSVLRG